MLFAFGLRGGTAIFLVAGHIRHLLVKKAFRKTNGTMFCSTTLVAKRRLGAEDRTDPNDGRLRVSPNPTNGTLLTDPGCSLVAAGGDKDRYLFAFEPDDTKNERELNGELPPEMTQFVDRYLKVHRKNLLARGTGDPTNRLWIDRWGQPMADHSIRAQIESRTTDAFGRHVWPHLFRAIAATGFVDLAPEDAVLVPDLLGHTFLPKECLLTKKFRVVFSKAGPKHPHGFEHKSASVSPALIECGLASK